MQALRALEQLKELEPWAFPLGVEAGVSLRPSSVASALGDTLERLAGRVRSGAVRIGADATYDNDAGALTVVLAALLRDRPV
ncbi:MAG: hypothetical protein WKG32_12795 [Gemmatimonadaceae bacterium]